MPGGVKTAPTGHADEELGELAGKCKSKPAPGDCGPEALKYRMRSGRPSKLGGDRKEALRTWILEKPEKGEATDRPGPSPVSGTGCRRSSRRAVRCRARTARCGRRSSGAWRRVKGFAEIHAWQRLLRRIRFCRVDIEIGRRFWAVGEQLAADIRFLADTVAKPLSIKEWRCRTSASTRLESSYSPYNLDGQERPRST